jgi:hypothetical protein
VPQVPAQEFEGLPLRVHAFLAGVPLHDVWSIDLPRWRAGVTLDEFLRAASNRLFTLSQPSPLVRMLREPAATAWETFATHLTDADQLRSLAFAGTLGCCSDDFESLNAISRALKRARIADTHTGVLYSAGAGRRGSVTAPSPRAPQPCSSLAYCDFCCSTLTAKRGHFYLVNYGDISN